MDDGSYTKNKNNLELINSEIFDLEKKIYKLSLKKLFDDRYVKSHKFAILQY